MLLSFLQGKKVELSRHSGVQMKVAYPKDGTGPDSMFDRTIRPLQEGIRFIDNERIGRLKDLELSKSLAGKKPFLPSSPGKKPIGSGSLIGCLGEVPLGMKPLHGATETVRRGPYRQQQRHHAITSLPPASADQAEGRGEELLHQPDAARGRRLRDDQPDDRGAVLRVHGG